MHFKFEIRKIIDTCKSGGIRIDDSLDSLLLKLLYASRHEDGEPLVNLLYDLIDLGFNPFRHHGDPLFKIFIKNIVAVCDKELSIIKTCRHANKKNC